MLTVFFKADAVGKFLVLENIERLAGNDFAILGGWVLGKQEDQGN